MSVPAPGAHGASAVELLVIQRDVVVHVALSMVSEDLVPTKTLKQKINTEVHCMHNQAYKVAWMNT